MACVVRNIAHIRVVLERLGVKKVTVSLRVTISVSVGVGGLVLELVSVFALVLLSVLGLSFSC